MHPLFSRPARILLYLLAWAAAGLLLAAWFARGGALAYPRAVLFSVPLALAYGLIALSAWWVCRAHPVTGEEAWRVGLAQLGAAAQASLAWGGLGAAWALALTRLSSGGAGAPAPAQAATALFAAGVPVYLVSAVVHYLFAAVEASHAAERRALEAQVLAREAELRALRAQLNPHFLFNSLNSINALVGRDPEGARRMGEGLGDFLRLTLKLGALESVTLEDELRLADRYFAIEQVRFGERLAVERRIAPATLRCLLPPLLLQPLLENAVKHGVAGRVEGGTVRLESVRAEGRLVVTVQNPVDAGEAGRPGTGTGLANVRRRLAALGGREAQLTVRQEAGVFTATLRLPAVEAAHEVIHD